MAEELSGLQLREAVAREVMGLDGEFWSHDGYVDGETGQKVFCPTLCYDKPLWPPPTTCVVPAYESSIEAAWSVVEKMRESGFIFVLTSPQDEVGEPNKWCVQVGKLGGTSPFMSSASGFEDFWADTAPEAICRAALAARAKA